MIETANLWRVVSCPLLPCPIVSCRVIRACRDAVLANFAGPDLVKRVVAGEVFRVWNKRRGESAWASRRADAAAASASAVAATAATASTDLPRVGVLPAAPISSESLLIPLGGEADAELPQMQQQQLASETSTQGAVAAAAAEVASEGTLLSATEEADFTAVDGPSGSGGVSPGNSHLAVAPATARPGAPRIKAATAGGASTRPPAFASDDIVTLSSPASFPGAPRIELRLTVGELRRARQTRVTELKRLVAAVLKDPKVQAGELEVFDDDMGSPAITKDNLSGAAAAAAAAGVAAVVNRANSHTVALLASGQENRGLPSRSTANTGGCISGSLDVGSKVAEKWGATLLRRGKRARGSGGVDVGSGDGCVSGDGWGIDPSGAISAAPAGVSVMPTTVASTQRRQLWALAIRENELLYEREKEAAREEYDARQQELLRWMVDEEAGRHDALGGDAGPPPPQAGVDD